MPFICLPIFTDSGIPHFFLLIQVSIGCNFSSAWITYFSISCSTGLLAIFSLSLFLFLFIFISVLLGHSILIIKPSILSLQFGEFWQHIQPCNNEHNHSIEHLNPLPNFYPTPLLWIPPIPPGTKHPYLSSFYHDNFVQYKILYTWNHTIHSLFLLSFNLVYTCEISLGHYMY